MSCGVNMQDFHRFHYIRLPMKVSALFHAQIPHKFPYTCCFYLVLFLILFFLIFFNNVDNYKRDFVIGGDTYGYPHTQIERPWAGLRTPGFFLYLKALGAQKPLQDFFILHGRSLQEMNAAIRSHAFVNSFFRNFLLANTVFLALGLTFLSFSLAKVLPSENRPWLQQLSAAALIIVCTRYAILLPLQRVLADSLAIIIVPYAMGTLLLFFHGHKFRWLLCASLLAAYSFLVKPAFAFLPFLCGLICAWELGKSLIHKHYVQARSALLTGILLSAATLAWPLWLFWHGGIFVPSQISAKNNFGFVFFITKPGDEALLQNERDKKILMKIHELQPEITTYVQSMAKNIDINKKDLSTLQLYYRTALNYVIGARIMPDIWKELGLDYSYLGINKIVSSFAPTIIREHFDDYLKIVASSFLGAFNQLYPKQIHFASAKWISSHYRRTACLILLGLLFGIPQLRVPILLFTSTHVLHMLCCSIGSCMETRYVSTTEFCMLLAFLISLYSLSLRLLSFFLRKFPAIAIGVSPHLSDSDQSECERHRKASGEIPSPSED